MRNDDTFYRRLLDNVYDGVFVMSPDRKISYWNQGAERLTGFKASEVIGRCCKDNILNHVDKEGKRLCGQFCPLAKTIQDGQEREEELYLHHKDGHRVAVRARMAPLRDAGGKIIGGIEVFSDNSAKVAVLQRVEELERMALLDPLTRLANRRYVEMNLQARLDEMKRYGWPFGILFIDLDHFKRINDEYGHDVGDRALKMVASTLSNNVRSFDVVGRWGGEEFVAIIPNVNEDQLCSIAEKLRMLVEQSFLSLNSAIIRLRISIGAALAQNDDTADTLLKRADRLMYQSKIAGRNRVSVKLGK